MAALATNWIDGVALLPGFPIWLWLFAGLIGFIFIANFFIFSKSTHRNGVGVSVAAMRLSMVVPILVSILIFSETMTVCRSLGIVLVLIALGLLIASRRDIKPGMVNNHWLLIGIFVFTGITDASFKVFEQRGLSDGTEAQFMSIVFFSSLVFGLIGSARRTFEIKIEEVKMGVLIGLPNLFTTIFLIKALTHADGIIVYPAVNILIIIGGALIGKFYWDDKISPMEASGMGLAILAILLLL